MVSDETGRVADATRACFLSFKCTDYFGMQECFIIEQHLLHSTWMVRT
jgi:hypothetical protein